MPSNQVAVSKSTKNKVEQIGNSPVEETEASFLKNYVNTNFASDGEFKNFDLDGKVGLENIDFGLEDPNAENGTIALEDLNIVLDGLIGNDDGNSLLGGLVAGLQKFSLKANEEEDGNFGLKGLINDNKNSSKFGLNNFGLFGGNITGIVEMEILD